MNKLLMLSLGLLMVGCTKGSSPVCEVAKVIAQPVAQEIAAQLDCKDVDAINATLVGQLEALKVCEPKTSSVIGEIICPRLIDGLVSGVLKQIPAAWKCTGGDLKTGAAAKLLEVCRKSI